MWCINRGRSEEALFWALELIESDMGTELARALIMIWGYAFGILRMDWLNKFIGIIDNEETERDDYLYLVWNLSETKERDGSILAMLGAGLEKMDAPPDRMNCELTVENALAKRKGFLAWCLLKGCWDWDKIPSEGGSGSGSKEACMWLESSFAGCENIARVAAVLAVTMRGYCNRYSLRSTEIPYEKVSEIDSLLGRRRRRIYKIPDDALAYITARGGMAKTGTTIEELRWHLIKDQVGWENAEFDEIFPDDIPDEWDLGDQKKSHGAGLGLSDKRLACATYLKSWFGKYMARGCWGKLGKAIELIAENADKGFEELYGGDESGTGTCTGTCTDPNRWKNHFPPIKKIRKVVVK